MLVPKSGRGERQLSRIKKIINPMKTCTHCGGNYPDHSTNCEKGHLLINTSGDEVAKLPATLNPYVVTGQTSQEVGPITMVKAPLKAGWICLILGYVLSALGYFPSLRVLTLVVCGCFGFASIILGIVCMVRKRRIQGLLMIVLNPLIYQIIILLIGVLWIFQVIREPEKKVDYAPPSGGSEHAKNPVR